MTVDRIPQGWLLLRLYYEYYPICLFTICHTWMYLVDPDNGVRRPQVNTDHSLPAAKSSSCKSRTGTCRRIRWGKYDGQPTADILDTALLHWRRQLCWLTHAHLSAHHFPRPHTLASTETHLQQRQPAPLTSTWLFQIHAHTQSVT